VSPDLNSQVELDLGQLEQLLTTYAGAFARAAKGEPDHETLVVLATALHGLYNGAENALKRILSEIDGVVPKGETSHSELLRQASVPTERRPAVISNSLHDELRPIMAFRHFFRHAYAFQFEWEKIAELVGNFGHVVKCLREELTAFLQHLDSTQ